MKNSDIISLKCHDCGDITTVKFGYYKSKPVDYMWRCKKCRVEYHKNWYKNKTPEEKKKSHDKMSNSAKLRYQNMSKGEKAERSTNQSIKMINYWKLLSPNDYSVRCKIAKETWNNMSEESRKLHRDHISESQKKVWSNLSDEEYHYRCYCNSIAAKTQWENIDEFEMEKIRKTASVRFKKWWETRTKEDLVELSRKRAEGIHRKFIENELNPNKNELAVINMLNIYSIPWERLWQNKKVHEDFYKLFPYNPITGSKIVEPLHVWDLMIQLPNGNKILIDVDGSVHDPNKTSGMIYSKYTGKRYKLSDSQKFNESQRPYQTDGYDAYIIQCYDDNVTLNSDVIKVNSCEKMTLKLLLSKLSFEFIDNNEIKEIISEII